MKILLATGIYPPDIGGPATYTRSMARALKERGHEVEVVCYGDRDSGFGIRDSERDFFVYSIRRSLVLPLRYLAFAWKVFRRARAMNADVVYLQGPGSEGFPGTIGAMLAGVPTVMKVVGDYAWEIYQGSGGVELLDEFITRRHSGKVGILERIERWTVKHAKRIITPSKYLASIVEKWGVPIEQTSVIYNQIQSLPEGMSRKDARRSFGVEDKKVLFTAVRIVPWKNIDFIIRLLPKLDDKNTILVIAGDGPDRAKWQGEVEKAGIKDRVKFLGKLDRKQMGEWYRAADLFVLPSLYEGYPNVIPEAWSQGLPCFVSDRGGNPEIHAYKGLGWRSFPEPQSIGFVYELDEEKWINELNQGFPDRFDAPEIDVQANFNAMVQQTLNVLESSISSLNSHVSSL